MSPLADFTVVHSATDVLAHELAYSCARSDVECCCTHVRSDDAGHWYDTTPNAETVCEPHVIERAVRYLDSRGLLRRDPSSPHIVQVRDVPA
ncbi:hypothetical protein ACQQ2N_12305 [Dokdonella sp. MW10]|uniref:hypothetical protein n=1 Tax=Dokdonella sp. MW10 TaxID=2992926 RepID=UPI003F801AFC